MDEIGHWDDEGESDVRDYLRVAPRYGTNDDLVELVAAARERPRRPSPRKTARRSPS